MGKLIILDFNTGKVLILSNFNKEEPEITVEENYYSINECNWMVTDEEIIIK